MTCRECCAWQEDDALLLPNATPDDPEGECHGAPPVCFPARRVDGSPGVVQSWARTRASQFCLGFVAREAAENADPDEEQLRELGEALAALGSQDGQLDLPEPADTTARPRRRLEVVP